MDAQLNDDARTAPSIDGPGDQLEGLLHEQGAALHRGDLAASQTADAGLALLAQLPPPADQAERLQRLRLLTHLRSLALYNQLLLRLAFTAWAAQRIESRRRAPFYDAHGDVQRTNAALSAGHVGVL